ncbi:MAG: folate-binding protein [Candidatus Protistobacter heckmanni]|nr:folate-binding protein [Candidatus Protistobacter heckmanni]
MTTATPLSDPAPREQAAAGSAARAPEALPEHAFLALPEGLGLIAARGPEAADFLHNQLTNAVDDLPPGELRLAGYCTAKGRLLATMYYWRQTEADGADAVYLLVSRDLLPALLKRLSMFVLRAKVKLADASGEYRVIGLAGGADGGAPAALPVTAQASAQTAATGAAQSFPLPDAASRRRALAIVPAAQADAALAALRAQAAEASPAAWDWLDVQAGVPRIAAATQDLFVPQMINFELVGGVNFKKGCYPGQEVVARSQYRGTVKRRLRLAHVDAQALPAQELFHSADPGQPCGQVVNAVAAPQGGCDLLAEIKLDALEGGSIHLDSPEGPALTLKPLPYDA